MPEIDHVTSDVKPKYGAFSSSENPQNLSLTMKGALIALIPLFIQLGPVFGFAFTETDLMGWVEGISTIVAAGAFIYGLWRKLRNRNA